MKEEFAVCGRCGREVPRTMYCIYCGSALSKVGIAPAIETDEGKSSEEHIDAIKPSPFPDVPDEQFFQTPSYNFDVQEEPPQAMDDELDPETVQLAELRKYQIWKVKLCGLLVEGGVTEGVFTKIYKEYADEINKVNKIRDEKNAYYTEQYEERKDQLSSSKMEHEELLVRTAVGQVPESELLTRIPGIAKRIDALSLETSRLEAKLSQLNDVMGDVRPKEAFEIQKTARRCIESLDDLVSNGKIGDELGNTIREDLESVLTLFDAILGDKRQAEKALRDELETLEVRYKVGEFTLSEYESLKRGTLEKLEQLWA